jgi:pimeloyl-ACP methyl ester carboxylesterase
MTKPMPFLTSPDGVRLKCEIQGDGRPSCCNLGAGCHSGLWRAAGYLEPLAAVDRYVIDVLSLLDARDITRTAFGAYSNGISVGLKLADDHPERLWALVGSALERLGKPVASRDSNAISGRGARGIRTTSWRRRQP